MLFASPRQLTRLDRGIVGYLDQLKEPMSPDSGLTVRLKRWVGNSAPSGRSLSDSSSKFALHMHTPINLEPDRFCRCDNVVNAGPHINLLVGELNLNPSTCRGEVALHGRVECRASWPRCGKQLVEYGAFGLDLQRGLLITKLQRDKLIVEANSSGKLIVIAVNCHRRVVAGFEFA